MTKKPNLEDIAKNNKLIAETEEIEIKVKEIEISIEIKKIDTLKKLLESINLDDELSAIRAS